MGDVVQTDFGAIRDRREIKQALSSRIRRLLESGLPQHVDACEPIVNRIMADVDEFEAVLAAETSFASLPVDLRMAIGRIRNAACRQIRGSAYDAIAQLTLVSPGPSRAA